MRCAGRHQRRLLVQPTAGLQGHQQPASDFAIHLSAIAIFMRLRRTGDCFLAPKYDTTPRLTPGAGPQRANGILPGKIFEAG